MVYLTGKEIGRYHIVERLGEGGMANVYKAYDTRLERDVAIKVIRTGDIPPNMLPSLMRRFEQEAKSLAKFDHPNIVSIYDFGEYQDAPYLVMQYLPGGTLKEYAGGRKLPYQEAARITLAIARALDYAHRRGVIHRDVKPANVLITESGEVKLSDFGIAKILESDQATQLTGTGVGIGTPEYMAPEQWEGKVLPQTDIYALGVVFYELLTGRRPYEADTPAAIYKKMLVDPLPRPGSFGSRLPDEAEQVLLKALSKNPKDRYGSMEKFARALESLALLKNKAYVAAEKNKKAPVTLVFDPSTKIPRTAHESLFLTDLKKQQPVKRKPGYPEGKMPRRNWIWLAGGGVMAIFLFGLVLGQCTGVKGSLAGLLVTQTATCTCTPQATETLQATNTPELGIGSTKVNEKDGMEMVYVPEGEFEMGSNEGDSDEEPVHSVYLDAFWTDRTEVTNAMYAAFLNEQGNQSEGGETWLDGDDKDVLIVMDGGSWKPVSGYENHPVIEVNWYGARAYCKWADRRLLSEAEWEKAARGTDGRVYPWGSENPSSGNLANYYGANDVYKRTAPVGSYSEGASPYGSLDMAGNVWEWVNDRYASGYYSKSPKDNPQGPESGEYRVLRGGSWHDIGYYLSSADRSRYYPDDTYNNSGFRCAVSAASP